MLSAIVIFYQVLLNFSEVVNREYYPLLTKEIDILVDEYRKNISQEEFDYHSTEFQQIILQIFSKMSIGGQEWFIETFLVQVEENLHNQGFEKNSFLEMITDIFHRTFPKEE